jgi:hypothetical protein
LSDEERELERLAAEGAVRDTQAAHERAKMALSRKVAEERQPEYDPAPTSASATRPPRKPQQ